MRERQRLDDAINAYNTLARELADNLELIEMGEAEGDAEVVGEAEAALQALAMTRNIHILSPCGGKRSGGPRYHVRDQLR